jgi:hypothetical protein
MSRRRLAWCLLVLLLCPALLTAAPAPRLLFSPPEWKFGMIVQGTKIQADVAVTNGEPVAVTVTFLPTCTCVEVTPASQSIPAGGRAVFSLRYDSVDDQGLTTRGYRVKTDLAGAPPLYFLVRGTVRQERGWEK